MDSVIDNENPVSKEFPILFHYTSVSAFENIYREHKFRATHYEDLNDQSELGRFRFKVYKFIEPIIREIFDYKMQSDEQIASSINEDGGLQTVVDREAEMHLDILYRNTFGRHGYEPFICSFCAHDAQAYDAKHGLLSQWRGYGTDGGVAIVLNTREIERMLKYECDIFAHPVNHIGNTVYDDEDAKIKEEFYQVFEHFPEILNTLYSFQRPNYTAIYDHFLLGSTLVKHRAFHEENEVRIVVAPRPSKDSIFYNPEHTTKRSKIGRYAQKGNREIRYIELFGHVPLPIERVIIGPSQIQNVNYQRIIYLVKNSEIEIGKSEIPLRV